MIYPKSAAAVLLVLFLLIAAVVQAASSGPTPGTRCDFGAGVGKLAEIKAAPASDYPESVRMELAARKELLYSVLDCLITETEELKKEVDGLPDGEDTAGIKKEAVGKIMDARAYLERQKGQIQNLGIQGSKNLAREIRNWRDNSYAQLENEANNLKIWSGNQSLFEIAGNRLQQIQQTVRLLKLLENDEIRSMYEKSETSLETAGRIHRRALQNIKSYRSQEEIAASLKDSLEALSQTYKDFLDLSQAAKKILPL